MTKPKSTLATIAELAGVSTGTVSRVLREHPAISAKTAQRVRKVANQLGYRQNPLVSEVMRHVRRSHDGGQRGNVAYLTFGAPADAWRRHLTFLGFFEGARARCDEMGFSLDEIWADEPGMKSARLRNVLLSRGITGVLVGPTVGLPVTPALDWDKFSAVKVGVPLSDLMLPCVMSNQFDAMQRVLEELRARGYRRPGLVLEAHQNLKTSSMWLAPYLEYLQRTRRETRISPLILSSWREAAFERWFRQQRPDVVIGLRSELMRWMQRLGREPGRDIGFVHLDRGTETGNFAGIDQHPRMIGAAAVDLLASRLVANDRGVPPARRQLMIDGSWTNGPTVRGRNGG